MNADRRPFELVLSHQYATGAALDSSGFENNGRVEGDPLRVEGARPGSGALAFDGVDDRIVVAPSRSLRDIEAIRVDATLRLDELGGRRTVVEGFGSFSLLVEPDGVLEGTIYNGSRWEGVRTAQGRMPVGTWTRLTYVWDGLDTSALYLDGELAALDTRALGRMEPVDWPFGVSVGAWPERDIRMFTGRIEALKIWRRAG